MKEICKCCGQEIPNKDDISYSQHKLYRSFLLPALTEALGESNNQYCHEFILKPEWIYRQIGEYFYPITNFEDIPVKHQKSARIITLFADTKHPFLAGYVPSMAAFTKKETKEYFLYCETMLEEIGGSIPIDCNQEYSQLRTQVIR